MQKTFKRCDFHTIFGRFLHNKVRLIILIDHMAKLSKILRNLSRKITLLADFSKSATDYFTPLCIHKKTPKKSQL
jgi:hypothetical protein